MSSLRYAVEDRKADAVAHLACVLGVKIQGTAFWGVTKDKGGRPVRPLFAMAISQSPGLPVTLATACTPGMCLLVLPVIVSRKPRDSRVVP